MWSDTLRCIHMTPRLRGRHWLMSFVGFIGVLVENSGVIPWLERAFTSVPNILIGNKLSMNICALRFKVLELLRGFVNNLTSFS